VFGIDRLVIAPLALSRGVYFLIQNGLLASTGFLLLVSGFFQKRELEMMKGMLRIRGKNEMTMSPQDPVQRMKERSNVSD
jgi:hypothetical protein